MARDELIRRAIEPGRGHTHLTRASRWGGSSWWKWSHYEDATWRTQATGKPVR